MCILLALSLSLFYSLISPIHLSPFFLSLSRSLALSVFPLAPTLINICSFVRVVIQEVYAFNGHHQASHIFIQAVEQESYRISVRCPATGITGIQAKSTNVPAFATLVCPDSGDSVLWTTVFVFFYERNRVLVNKNACRENTREACKREEKLRTKEPSLLPCFTLGRVSIRTNAEMTSQTRG